MVALSLKARALRLLATREHSRSELARKLERPRSDGVVPDAAEVAAVLDALVAEGWLSDARFAASLARRRGRKYGNLRIARELRSHGLDPDVVAGTVGGEIEGSELSRALEALRRRHPDRAVDARTLARQQRFLLARGFSAGTVRRALRAHNDVDSELSPDIDPDSP